MSNPFSKEKELINTLVLVDQLVKKLQLEAASLILRKGQRSSIPMAKELRQRCVKFGEVGERIFSCKYCKRTFTEGRQLGGHISRAHKEQHLRDKDKEGQSIKKETEEITSKQRHKRIYAHGYRKQQKLKSITTSRNYKVEHGQSSQQEVFLQDEQ